MKARANGAGHETFLWICGAWASLFHSAIAEAQGPLAEDAPLVAEDLGDSGTGSGVPAPAPVEHNGTPQKTSLAQLFPHFELHGGMAVYLYQPTNGYEPLYNIYSRLKIKAHWEWFGLYMEPRLTSEKMRSYYDGLIWIQEAYAYAQYQSLTLKVGKVYKQLGLFSDNSFYGNIQMYEGLKFDPNSGVSLEGKWGKSWGSELFAQYFVVDGVVNASLPGRDTVSIPGARRRNIFTARAQPYFEPNKNLRLQLGVSGETFEADLPEGKNRVGRLALDLKLQAYGLSLWGEVLQQWGAHVNAFPEPGDPSASPPVPGRSSASNTYLLAGAEWAIGPVVPRYNLSIADYRDVWVREILHLLGITYNFHEHGTIYVEYAFWDRHAPSGRTSYDRSLNLTVLGFF